MRIDVRKKLKPATAALGGLLTLCIGAPGALADDAPMPSSTGNAEKGSMTVILRRGGAPALEALVITTPNDCLSLALLNISWDKQKNRVDLRLTGDEGTLRPLPTVTRTLGVSYQPNAFLPEPQSYANARYQLWLIGAGPMTTFYYRGDTLDLVGSQYDFPSQPAGTIPVAFPTLVLFPTAFFQPNARGELDFHWTFPYDRPFRGDRPEFSYLITTFPPPNLCGVNPFRLDLSNLRPYATDPFPANQAKPWLDYLTGGMLFDITVEPPTYFHEPPRFAGVSSLSGATAVAGGVPNGWNLDIDAAFMNIAPPIRPWAGAGACVDTFQGFHTKNINFCAAH